MRTNRSSCVENVAPWQADAAVVGIVAVTLRVVSPLGKMVPAALERPTSVTPESDGPQPAVPDVTSPAPRLKIVTGKAFVFVTWIVTGMLAPGRSVPVKTTLPIVTELRVPAVALALPEPEVVQYA